MKGVSIAVVGSVMLALIGVMVMIALFTDVSNLSGGSGFCSVFSSISPSLPDAISPSATGCSSENKIDYREVSTSDVDKMSLKLATGINQCWDKYKGYDTGFKRCKAWQISDLDSKLNESYVNTKMMEYSFCPELIENSKIDGGSGSQTCGSANNIHFIPDEIGNQFIIVGYNTSGSESFVEVR